MLSNVSIGTRIGLLVVAAVVALAALAIAAVVAERRVFQSAQELEQFRGLFERTTDVERHVGRLRFEALRFVTDRDAAAADTVATAAREIDELLARIEASPAAALRRSEVGDLKVGFADLVRQFAGVVTRAEELGLDHQSGLRGRLRLSATSVEDELKRWPNIDRLLVRMETMRRAEKDFVIYNDEMLLGSHRKAFNEFNLFVTDSGLDDATADNLTGLVKLYRSDLNRLVEGTRQFRVEVSAFNAAFEALQPKFAALLEAAQTGMTEAVEGQQRVRTKVIATTAVIVSVLFAKFLVMSLMLARSIGRPIVAIEKTMQRLASGDHDTAIPGTDRRDEIGLMARAVEVFKENMQHTRRLEQEAREAERRAAEERQKTMIAVADDFQAAFARVLDTVDTASDHIRNGSFILRDTAEKMREQALGTSEQSEKTSEVVGTVKAVSQTLFTSIGEIGSRVTESTAAVQRAGACARRSGSAVQALSDSSDRIGKIVDLISNIADTVGESFEAN
jgi:methyl-accepting chemotaxis protein